MESRSGQKETKTNNQPVGSRITKYLLPREGSVIYLIGLVELNKEIVVASSESNMHAVNITTGAIINTLSNKEFFKALTRLDDERVMVICDAGKIAIIWNIHTNEIVEIPPQAPKENISVLTYLAENKIIIGGSEGTIGIWDINKKSYISSFKAHNHCVSYLLNIDENTFASCSNSGIYTFSHTETLFQNKKIFTTDQVKLWDKKTFQCVKKLDEHTEGLRSLVLLPEGRLLGSCEKRDLMTWDIGNGKLLGKYNILDGMHEQPYILGLRDNVLILLSIGTGANVNFYDCKTMSKVTEPLRCPFLDMVSTRPDIFTIFLSNGMVASILNDRLFYEFSLTLKTTPFYPNKNNNIKELKDSAKAAPHKNLSLWDPRREITEFIQEEKFSLPSQLAFFTSKPNGSQLVELKEYSEVGDWVSIVELSKEKIAVSTTKFIYVIKLGNKKYTNKLPIEMSKALTAIDSERVAAIENVSKSVIVWNIKTNQVTHLSAASNIKALLYLGEEKLALAGDNIEIWDLKRTASLVFISREVVQFSGLFNIDGNSFASFSDQGNIYFWNKVIPLRNKETYQLRKKLTLNTADISSYTVLSGSRLLGCSKQNQLIVWDTDTTMCLGRYNSCPQPYVLAVEGNILVILERELNKKENRIHFYDSNTFQEVGTPVLIYRSHSEVTIIPERPFAFLSSGKIAYLYESSVKGVNLSFAQLHQLSRNEIKSLLINKLLILDKNKNLNWFSLENLNISDEDLIISGIFKKNIPPLLEFFKNNLNITHMDLRKNNITFSGLIKFAEALKDRPTELIIFHDNITLSTKKLSGEYRAKIDKLIKLCNNGDVNALSELRQLTNVEEKQFKNHVDLNALSSSQHKNTEAKTSSSPMNINSINHESSLSNVTSPIALLTKKEVLPPTDRLENSSDDTNTSGSENPYNSDEEEKLINLSPNTQTIDIKTQEKIKLEQDQLAPLTQFIQHIPSTEELKNNLTKAQKELASINQQLHLINGDALAILQGQAKTLSAIVEDKNTALHAQQERDFILQLDCLKDYYYVFTAQLSSAWMACKSIHSGKIEHAKESKDTIPTVLDKLADYIALPGAKLAADVAGAGFIFWSMREKQKVVNHVANYFDERVAFEIMEAIARRLTLSQINEIQKLMGPKTKQLDKIIDKLKSIKAAILVEDIDNNVKEKAVEDCKKILAAIVNETLNPRPSFADITKIVEVILGFDCEYSSPVSNVNSNIATIRVDQTLVAANSNQYINTRLTAEIKTDTNTVNHQKIIALETNLSVINKKFDQVDSQAGDYVTQAELRKMQREFTQLKTDLEQSGVVVAAGRQAQAYASNSQGQNNEALQDKKRMAAMEKQISFLTSFILANSPSPVQQDKPLDEKVRQQLFKQG